MKLTRILYSVCIVALALISQWQDGAKAQSKISTAHPAISGRIARPNQTVAPAPRNRLATPSPAALSAPDPELPRVYLNTNYVTPTGQTIAVTAGGNLQSALDQAQPGDVILLQAGATFTGNFVLPNKNGAGWITVRTATSDANLPPGSRVTPASASLMPKIISPNSEPAARTTGGAHHFRFVGIEFGVAPGAYIYSIVAFDANQNSLAETPHDLIIDRCYIHGNAGDNARRGVMINSASTAIIDSYISDIHEVGADSQAIAGWNSPGPFKIVNNYLEAAGENFMLGGADPSIQDLVQSDIEFRNNHCFKPLRWKPNDPSFAGKFWTVKNLFELKNAQRVWVDGNVFENNWSQSQDGMAILFTPRNQNGKAPWSVVRDVTFTNNVVRHSGGCFNISGPDDEAGPSLPSQRILIKNNLIYDINGQQWKGGTEPADGEFLQIVGGPIDIRVDHNTVFQSGSIITADYAPSKGFSFTNNIAPHNLYGVIGSDHGSGNDTISYYFPGCVFEKNVIVGAEGTKYPANNFMLHSLSQVGFVNLAGGDFRLVTTSLYKNAGSDGQDIGCLLGADSFPKPSPTSTPTPAPTPASPPSNVQASSITSSVAVITWKTGALSDSQAEYGRTSDYGVMTQLNPIPVFDHAVILTGLTANTMYHYRVRSRDLAGNLNVSADSIFTTSSASVAGGGAQGVIWTNIVNAALTGTTLEKTAGCDGCVSTAVSQQVITSGNGYLEFTASEMTKERSVGLMRSDRASSALDIDYAVSLGSDGGMAIRERGQYRMDMRYQTGDVFRVAVENGVVAYYRNGARIYQSLTAPGYPLVAAASLVSLNATISNAVITTFDMKVPKRTSLPRRAPLRR
ncbi:MAG TPA: fibronectin type III domain-containing protein [Blastocatellia bacterium]|nr:fibronectin type III domain-containing protein [Blastocatellia bacterium]